ncbi:C2 domain-containing protein [Glomus cerebriforme]|uniref:C2 domain-containing protein n=1 Tax=Glomus cerebriforme TaxID=658196 RepID=A0A397SNI0_9GLOM|nr:C2 domain-containing protein [Glomus cerebriforme]
MPYGQLEVTVVEGRKLKETDFFDKADPYVRLSLDKQNKQKTRAIDDAGSEATWNEKFVFDVVEGRNELFIEVFDEDVGSDDLIGGTTVPLSQVFQQGYVDQWIHITRPSGKPAGEIHLLMKFNNLGPTSGPPGHTPYPVPDGPGYFSPPVSGGSAHQGYAGNQIQQEVYSNLGPEGGALPSGYGTGTPPPIKAPQSTGPPAYPTYPTTGGGFPDTSSYVVNMPGQSQAYYQQPSYGPPPSDYRPPPSDYRPPPSDYRPPPSDYRPPPSDYRAPPSDYKPPSSEQHHKGKEQKSSGDNDWVTTAGIAVAAAAGAGALGFLGGKIFEEDKEKHKHEKHKEEKHKDKHKHKDY